MWIDKQSMRVYPSLSIAYQLDVGRILALRVHSHAFVSVGKSSNNDLGAAEAARSG